MAHWLTWKCAMGAVAAREHIRVGAALADLHHGAYTITRPCDGSSPGADGRPLPTTVCQESSTACSAEKDCSTKIPHRHPMIRPRGSSPISMNRGVEPWAPVASSVLLG